MIIQHERLFDLVRHQRGALFDADLITDDEFSHLLTAGSGKDGSVSRLENYDAIREQLDATRAALTECMDVWTCGDITSTSERAHQRRVAMITAARKALHSPGLHNTPAPLALADQRLERI